MATLQALILCDFAQVRDGLLFVSSGGVTRCWRQDAPTMPLGVYVAGTVQLEPHEAEKVHEIRIKVTSEGATYAEAVGAIQVAEDVDAMPGDCPVPAFAISLRSVAVDHHGVYDIATSVNGEEQGRLTFRVRPPPIPPAVE